jgi:hypothetical protein
MSRLVDIPRLEQRLRTHLTTMTWEESANALESNLNAVGEAGLSLVTIYLLQIPDLPPSPVAEIRDESCLSSLKELFSLILAVGCSPSPPSLSLSLLIPSSLRELHERRDKQRPSSRYQTQWIGLSLVFLSAVSNSDPSLPSLAQVGRVSKERIKG